jgi:hypothetical protein
MVLDGEGANIVQKSSRARRKGVASLIFFAKQLCLGNFDLANLDFSNISSVNFGRANFCFAALKGVP